MFQPDEPKGLRNIVLLWAVIYVLGLLFIRCEVAHASESWKLLDVDKLDLEYSQLQHSNRDPYAPGYTGRWRERAALKWDVSILKYVYWRNNVHTETIDTGQVKTVGWEWEAGIPLGKYLEIGHYHHSRHIMDESPQMTYFPDRTNQFPVEDAFLIRFHLLQKGK